MTTDQKSLAIIPTDIGGFVDLAGRFAKSALLPDALRAKPDDVFVTLLAGHELGLAPMAALREWRGSLIAPITCHFLHNGSIALVTIAIVAAID